MSNKYLKRIKKIDLDKLKKKTQEIERKYNFSMSYVDTEPFKEWLNKSCYIVGHSMDALYYDDNKWYLETKSYIDTKFKERGVIHHRHIHRFIFTGDLPIEIKRLLPKEALQIAKKGILGFDHIIELPAMGGDVIIIPAPDGTSLYYVKNPRIFGI